MILVNGQPSDSISVSDRGLTYGDGLFETLRVDSGDVKLWSAHFRRLSSGCLRLNIPLPDESLLKSEIHQVRGGALSGVLRITVTRGAGPRGYKSPVSPSPTRVVAFDSQPASGSFGEDGVQLFLCETRLGRNPGLSGMKHLNRLEQVLARSEWTEGFHEGLMLDSEGFVTEGTMSNVFLVSGNRLVTPILDQCGVSGVMRSLVLQCASDVGLRWQERRIGLDEVLTADGLFMTNSLVGVWPVVQFQKRRYEIPAVVRELQQRLTGEW